MCYDKVEKKKGAKRMVRQRLVVKVGTSTLLRESGGVNLREMDALAGSSPT